MDHNNQLGILIQETIDGGDRGDKVIFHFIHTDGNGKVHHSPHYLAANPGSIYEAQRILTDEWMTRDDVKSWKKAIRKAGRCILAYPTTN